MPVPRDWYFPSFFICRALSPWSLKIGAGNMLRNAFELAYWSKAQSISSTKWELADG